MAAYRRVDDLSPVYTIQPVVKQVVKPACQPVGCLFTRYSRLSYRLYNRFDNRLYRVNGVYYGHLRADCLYTGISSGPNARSRVWESLYLLPLFSTNTAISEKIKWELISGLNDDVVVQAKSQIPLH